MSGDKGFEGEGPARKGDDNNAYCNTSPAASKEQESSKVHPSLGQSSPKERWKKNLFLLRIEVALQQRKLSVDKGLCVNSAKLMLLQSL